MCNTAQSVENINYSLPPKSFKHIHIHNFTSRDIKPCLHRTCSYTQYTHAHTVEEADMGVGKMAVDYPHMPIDHLVCVQQS